MSNAPILTEFVALVRRVLLASSQQHFQEVGRHGEILYLVEFDVTPELHVIDMLIEWMATGEHHPDAAKRLQRYRDALQPYSGRKLLKLAMQHAARRHEFYVDPVSQKVAHCIWGELPRNQSPNFDPTDRSTWLNMHLEWFKTIEEDAAYHEWLESIVFREEFFDDAVFEASQTLYHVKLHDTLLEEVVWRGIQPAPFQKQELNNAVRDASVQLFGHSRAKWFHVNVHDNLARYVEKFGRYSFDYPLVPIYIMLDRHQAMEGGTTYAGLASADREWVLLFEDQLHISVHGPKPFVARVCESLRQNKPA